MNIVKEKFIISKIYGAFYEIYHPVLGFSNAVLKGKLRLAPKEERHPFVVGDAVIAEKTNEQEWMIREKLERKNFLARKSDPSDTHVLCANVDYLLVLASMIDPYTKDNFIDRCLAACYQNKIEPIILFSKIDLVSEDDVQERMEKYQSLGYTVFGYTFTEPDTLKPLLTTLQKKVTYICGNSGVGKSTLINLLTGKSLQKIGDVSNSTGKGKHTTTNSTVVLIDEATILIDSPGIKEWGLLHLTPGQIYESFPEFHEAQRNCGVVGCCMADKNCYIKENLDTIEISDDRILSLDAMLGSLEELGRLKITQFTRKRRR
jgi:ribosome biogenesis GTPase / thiamine phosphate phosphatase